MPETPQSGAELLARIQPQLRRGRTQVCLRPDLLDEHERLEQQLAESVTNDKAGQRLASGTSKRTRELASKVLTLEEQIEAASPWFTYEALPKDKFAVVKERHPPRKGNQIDGLLGYDRDAVLDELARACMVDPVFDDRSWAAFTSTLNASEWNELRDTASAVNGVVTELPKSSLAASVLTRRGAASKSPESGTPPPESLKGGPRKRSTSTTTPPAP